MQLDIARTKMSKVHANHGFTPLPFCSRLLSLTNILRRKLENHGYGLSDGRTLPHEDE